MNEAERDVVTRVKGFIEPIFIGDHVDGRKLYGVGPYDWQMIQEGYACGECMAIFDTYTVRCPLCKSTRDVLQDIKAPQDWLSYLAERDNPGEKPPLRTPQEAIYGASLDKDVDQIPISKLRKRRR